MGFVIFAAICFGACVVPSFMANEIDEAIRSGIVVK